MRYIRRGDQSVSVGHTDSQLAGAALNTRRVSKVVIWCTFKCGQVSGAVQLERAADAALDLWGRSVGRQQVHRSARLEPSSSSRGVPCNVQALPGLCIHATNGVLAELLT